MSGRALAHAAGPRSPFTPYVPRVLLRYLAEAPEERVLELHATMVFADVSGFTRLSERLARRGREGAEQLSDTISECFSVLLTAAYDNGGSLLKFGGDAMLLLFEGDGHLERACASAAGMRRLLRRVGRIERDGARTQLRMSIGVHTGAFHLFLVGGSHRELIIAGPGASEVVRMEHDASSGEIVLSTAAAAELPGYCLGGTQGGGRLLKRVPRAGPPPGEPRFDVTDTAIASCLSTAVREHIRTGVRIPEHRIANVAFIRFDGIDALIERRGAHAAAEALEELVVDVQRAADEHDVTFLGSDVDADGGKLLLASGAPRASDGDAERLLLTLRAVVSAPRTLATQAGAARGTVFTADVGPPYRRTYAAMGDTTNLAARLMAEAPAGDAYVNAALLEASATSFELTAPDPFMVKGKRLPVQAYSLGPVLDVPGAADVDRDGVALIGRERERRILRQALAGARNGHGRLIELQGEPGAGKSRMLRELRELAGELPALLARCEPYRSATPYSVWRQLIRQLLGLGWDEPDNKVAAELQAFVHALDPALVPWLPLIGIAAGVDLPATPEVDSIAPEFRTTALHEVVVRFLGAALRRAAVIQIEDAHAMDDASSDLLHALAKALPTLPCLVAASRRPGPAGYTPRAGVHVIRLALRPLDSAEALRLARAITERSPLPPHLLDAAVERCGGNPQFLRDLLFAARRHGADALPDTVESAAMARIDSLRAPDRELVRRASVLGAAFAVRQLEDVLGQTTPPDASTWRRLGGIFEFGRNGQVSFRQGVVREAAYAGLPFRLRRTLHRAVGEVLELELGEDGAAGPISHHFLRAGDDRRACRYARIAGEQAAARFAWADAAEHYGRALEAARRLDLGNGELVDLWLSLGEARARTGELSAATSAYTSARRLLAKDRLREAQILHLHALLSDRSGRVTATIRWARRGLRALDGLNELPAEACRARLLAALATARQRQGRHAEAIRICERAIAAAEASGEEMALAHACYILDWALFDAGRADEAVHSPRALEIYSRLGDRDQQAAVLNNLGAFAYHEGRWDEAVALYERAAAASASAGDVVNAAFGDCNVAEVRTDQGRLEEAEHALRRALLVWRGTEHESGVAFATAQLGRTAVRAGRIDEGVELIESAAQLARRLGHDAYSGLIDPLRAEALAFAGRFYEALVLAQRLLSEARERRTLPLLHRVRGFALAQRGDTDAAVAAVRESLIAARNLEMQFEIAASLDALIALNAAAREHAAERDEIMARLQVLGFARPAIDVRELV